MKRSIFLFLVLNFSALNNMFAQVPPAEIPLTSEQKKKLYFERLPRELRWENLRRLISGAKTPEEMIKMVKTTLATQNLTLSKKEVKEILKLLINLAKSTEEAAQGVQNYLATLPATLDKQDVKEILKIMWDRFRDYRLGAPFSAPYFDENGIALLSVIPSLQTELQKIKYENEFMKAVVNRDYNKVENYIIKGINVNIQRSDGKTALQIAWDDKLIELLLKNGANPNIKDENGNTVLNMSEFLPRKEKVSLLLRYGADPNLKMGDGLTPLFQAVMNNDPDMVKLLLDAGSDRSIRDALGKRTPLEWIEIAKKHIDDKKEADEIINLLKNYWPKKEQTK